MRLYFFLVHTLFKRDSNPNDKQILSERALWTMNFNTTCIGPTIAPMTSLPIQDGGPHDTKMAAPTTSGPRWRPHEVRYEMAAPVTRSVTPRRVSQRPRPREGSVTS